MSAERITDGYILLFHFDPKFGHAIHCWDWTEDINARIKAHYGRTSRGPNLIHRAMDAGSKLILARHWPGSREQMKGLRMGGNATRLCPICRREGAMQWQDEHLPELLQRSVAAAHAARHGEDCQDEPGIGAPPGW